ncbi:type II toxin-antitoxin system RelE/ParE family toxin [Catenibacterium mitsuokai]
MVCGYSNYIIFYQITKETILIVRILHRLQDYVKQLF